ncbi:MAG: (2Fe-2S) ferredoxin domain-containing protein [Chitinispirillia bacterium]|nr:(2Fe-2S) ferredoxin domain-containing protein [Chitinispirillia bacterium]MCL2268179.1 (2Fe-2S) ferredoxin domain-containing protein [Chitinispirillia bacterium]
MDKIIVCMGSSCFGKGNQAVAAAVTRFIEEHKLQDKIEVTGSLCSDHCAAGPNIKINDKLISGVSEQSIGALIVQELGLAL